MVQCVYCGIGRVEGDMCAFHTERPEDWAVANQLMCDFVHRKRVPLRPPGDEDFWRWQDRLIRFRTVGVA